MSDKELDELVGRFQDCIEVLEYIKDQLKNCPDEHAIVPAPKYLSELINIKKVVNKLLK